MLLGFGTALSFLIAAAWRIRQLMRGEVQLGRAETAFTAVVFVPSTGLASSVRAGSERILQEGDRQSVAWGCRDALRPNESPVSQPDTSSKLRTAW